MTTLWRKLAPEGAVNFIIVSHALQPVNGSAYAFATSAVISSSAFHQVGLHKARPDDCSSALFYRSPGRTRGLFRTHKENLPHFEDAGDSLQAYFVS